MFQFRANLLAKKGPPTTKAFALTNAEGFPEKLNSVILSYLMVIPYSLPFVRIFLLKLSPETIIRGVAGNFHQSYPDRQRELKSLACYRR